MQTLIIGNIHGCWQELQALLKKAGVSDSDLVISLSDLVDRWPDSPTVLSFKTGQILLLCWETTSVSMYGLQLANSLLTSRSA